MPRLAKRVLGGIRSYNTKLFNNFIKDNNINKKQDIKALKNWFTGGKTAKELKANIRKLKLLSKGKFGKLSKYNDFKERLSKEVVGNRKNLKPKDILPSLRDDYDFYLYNKKLIIATNRLAGKNFKKDEKYKKWSHALKDAANKVKDSEGKTLAQRHEEYFEKRKYNTIKGILDDAAKGKK